MSILSTKNLSKHFDKNGDMTNARPSVAQIKDFKSVPYSN